MEHDADSLTIRGTTIPLNTLVHPRIRDPLYRKTLRQAFEHAAPFPHLRLEQLFHPRLLELVREEFDLYPTQRWRQFSSEQERTFRSRPEAGMGPASRMYFSLVNSQEFVEFLGEITGLSHLIVDRTLFGGGLHESRSGGRFGIHRDFDRHAETGLHNEMVFLTYLNADWDPAWGGALELWDVANERSAASVQPEFGVSLLMRNRHDSFHGHPEPMRLPDGVRRRSLASYYYSNPRRLEHRAAARTTTFLQRSTSHTVRSSALRIARQWTPPALWDLARRLRHGRAG